MSLLSLLMNWMHPCGTKVLMAFKKHRIGVVLYFEGEQEKFEPFSSFSKCIFILFYFISKDQEFFFVMVKSHIINVFNMLWSAFVASLHGRWCVGSWYVHGCLSLGWHKHGYWRRAVKGDELRAACGAFWTSAKLCSWVHLLRGTSVQDLCSCWNSINYRSVYESCEV